MNSENLSGNERDLLVRAKNGDDGAGDELWGECVDYVVGTLRRRLRDEEEVKNALIAVHERFFRYLPTLRGDSKVSTWATKIAINCAYDARRKRKAREDLEILITDLFDPADGRDLGEQLDRRLGGDMSADPERMLLRKEESKELWAAIWSLSPIHREVIFLYYLEELPASKISEIIALPVGTVRSRVSAALQELRRLLKPRESGAELSTVCPKV